MVTSGRVSEAPALEHISSGKVRDIYAVGEDRLLLVASDRISTYDVVHPTPIPDKGKVLTGLTGFWLERTARSCPNHLISFTEVPEEFRGRAMLVERLEMVPVECVVRGYITGSGWKDYQATGEICGIELPEGLEESRAAAGADLHARDQGRAGRPRRERGLRPRRRDRRRPRAARGAAPAVASPSTSSARRTRASAGSSSPTPSSSSAAAPTARSCSGDEVLTPDSSRFWPADGYEPGRGQPSFDKQYVRDWASGSGWDKTPPAPRAAGRRDRAHARAVRGRVRAHHGRAVRGVAGALRLRARVLIRPKEGILDPQGQAVERALPALGFDGVQNVHVGRLIELDVEDASQVPQMCERLLANPLIEDYEVVELGRNGSA